ncbi:MAG: T9SS type A sorting domain-containing protein [Bacteroidetes bacterium]|nr:T9SS type A sorting domain-containing protein [Bacteroidota bacterium]
MKTSKFSFPLLVFFASVQFCLSQNSLRIINPQEWWWDWDSGKIEDVQISVEPKGAYMEVGLYLSLSAAGGGYTESDSLEIVFNFTLPDKAIVHDSWLWIEDTIVKGEIMDRWAASFIYEEIVARRTDPSILTKNNDNNYELRIYPLVANKPRKVKITYLTPADWTNNSVSAVLPTWMIYTSDIPVESIEVLTSMSGEWQHPRIREYPEKPFQFSYVPDFGNIQHLSLSNNDIYQNLHFSVDAPLTEGLYLNRYEEGDDNYYQLVMIPSEVFQLSGDFSENVLVLLDHMPDNSHTSWQEVQYSLKNQLRGYIDDNDHFNIVVSGLQNQFIANDWLAADSASIEDAFEELSAMSIPYYSNLPSLLATGIDFFKETGQEGKILLVANSGEIGEIDFSNQLTQDLLSLMGNNISPIYICDFQDKNYSWTWTNSRNYRGNEYFYTILSQSTRGEYSGPFNNTDSFSEKLNDLLNKLTSMQGLIDLHTTLDEGFCFGRYSLNNTLEYGYLNQPIVQIGKYLGDFPFIAEASGLNGSDLFFGEFEIDENTVYEADSLSEEMWYGNYLMHLEDDSYPSNNTIQEIISTSIRERVLSIYTAFLCLEPGVNIDPCPECTFDSGWDDEWVVSSHEALQISEGIQIKASPNPFRELVEINIHTPKDLNGSDMHVQIFNAMGQIVKTFNDLHILEEEIKIRWDGKDLAGQVLLEGMYVVLVTYPEGKVALKLLK